MLEVFFNILDEIKAMHETMKKIEIHLKNLTLAPDLKTYEFKKQWDDEYENKM